MSDISGTLDQIAKERKRLLPTIPVGWPCVWFMGGDENNRRPAQVTQVEGPGKVSLVVFPLNSVPQHKLGVLYKDHPDMEEANTPQKRTKGTWDYVPGLPSGVIPKEHYEAHKELLDKKEKMALAVLEQEQREAEVMAARQKELKSKREAATV